MTDRDDSSRIGSARWHHDRAFGDSDSDSDFDKEMDRMDRWFWRIFYMALALIVLWFAALIVSVVLAGLHFSEIVDFLRAFQPEVWL